MTTKSSYYWATITTIRNGHHSKQPIYITNQGQIKLMGINGQHTEKAWLDKYQKRIRILRPILDVAIL